MKLSTHFSRSEFACNCGCGFNTVDTELLTVLEIIREHFDSPIKITNGCRCLARNAEVGGAENSQHLIGRAADIQIDGVEPIDVQDYIDQMWPDQYGLGRYGVFTHVDTRSTRARWG